MIPVNADSASPSLGCAATSLSCIPRHACPPATICSWPLTISFGLICTSSCPTFQKTHVKTSIDPMDPMVSYKAQTSLET